MEKLVVLLGPTASGKTELSLELAKEFGGEIVSADSRQVYKGLDIGSGKIAQEEMQGVPHHLLDVASPGELFTAAQYQTLSRTAIEDIQNRQKPAFLVGGSPLYIYAATDGIVFPEVEPDPKLREELARLSPQELFEKLQSLDPKRAENVEKENPRRLIRALEIVIKTGEPVPEFKKDPLPYPILFLGIARPMEELKDRISLRLEKRLKEGLVEEVEGLHKQGLSWERLEDLGLEYRFCALYLQKKISYEEMVDSLKRAISSFARHQMTWFKRDKRIQWVASHQEARRLVEEYL